MSIPKPRTVLRILGFITVALLAWVALLPPLGRPDVSISLLRYTSDKTGNRIAVIRVTNLSDSKIFIYAPHIEIAVPKEPGGVAIYDSGRNIQWHSALGRGASGNFTTPPPTNQSRWSLSLRVANDLGPAQAIRRFGTSRHMPFDIRGDWIESEK